MKQIQMGLLASTIVLFTGCGGGGSTPTSTVTGQFVDTYVQGLDYACSSGKTDITNSLGEYTCNTGDIVTFS
ncbi:MAG: hypothetical protein HKP62_07595, partial [Sulfurovum sp.]|nr:hypothetical protein [Sulfurovum sp.]NNJ45864.1 hypothetical protein [Sulfurovum sp.]